MRTTVPRSERALIPACGIAVMAKASKPGRTKTRLVPPLTFEEAAACNTAFLCDVADNILAAAHRASIGGYMAFGPPQSEPFFQQCMPPEIGLIEAWYPNFGDCLFAAIAGLLERGHRSAVVLNSDSPTLPTCLLVEAANVLARPGDQAVLGPADDGGYYLLGLKTAHRRMFEDIVWSTEHVARQAGTCRRAGIAGARAADVVRRGRREGVADAAGGAARGPVLRGKPPPNQPRHTRALVQSLIERSDLRDRLAFARANQGAME